MKLSWKDLVTTLLAAAGAAVVWAKFYDYSWAGLGSWRSSVVALGVIGLLMFAFSSFDFDNRSVLNIGEMVVGVAAIILGVIAVIVATSPWFYSLAIVLGALWLSDTARHARHSIVDHDNRPIHHVPVH